MERYHQIRRHDTGRVDEKNRLFVFGYPEGEHFFIWIKCIINEEPTCAEYKIGDCGRAGRDHAERRRGDYYQKSKEDVVEQDCSHRRRYSDDAKCPIPVTATFNMPVFLRAPGD